REYTKWNLLKLFPLQQAAWPVLNANRLGMCGGCYMTFSYHEVELVPMTEMGLQLSPTLTSARIPKNLAIGPRADDFDMVLQHWMLPVLHCVAAWLLDPGAPMTRLAAAKRPTESLSCMSKQ